MNTKKNKCPLKKSLVNNGPAFMEYPEFFG